MGEIPPSVSRALVALSPLGRRQRLSILIYHRVLPEHDWMRPGEPTATDFAWQMRLLARNFNMLPLSEAVQKLQEGRLPPRTACVTFDDGYADNATVALPILQQHGIPATVFVATGYLNGGRMWNDSVIESVRRHEGNQLDLTELDLPVYPTTSRALRREAAYDILKRCKYLEGGRREQIAASISRQAADLPDNLMLTTEQLQTLHIHNVEIGGHTVTHPILSQLRPEQARDEIFRGKSVLENLIDAPLRLFAYPNGKPGSDYRQEHTEFVREAGFEAAVSTQWGVSDPQSDLFQLPRFTPWDRSSNRFLLRMALNSRHVAASSGEDRC